MYVELAPLAYMVLTFTWAVIDICGAGRSDIHLEIRRKSAEHIQISVLHPPTSDPVCRSSGRFPARSVVSPVALQLLVFVVKLLNPRYAELRRIYWR
jgi:hypothetical protein